MIVVLMTPLCPRHFGWNILLIECPSGPDFPRSEQGRRGRFLRRKHSLQKGTSAFNSGGAHRAQRAGEWQPALAKAILFWQQCGGGRGDGQQRWSDGVFSWGRTAGRDHGARVGIEFRSVRQETVTLRKLARPIIQQIFVKAEKMKQ